MVVFVVRWKGNDAEVGWGRYLGGVERVSVGLYAAFDMSCS
jgi:hypothetical protein